MKEKGQALIILIVAIAVAISVLSTAIFASIGRAKVGNTNISGEKAYYAAESGLEYALQKLLRNPNACSDSDTLNQDGAAITINYNQSGLDCNITSGATNGNITKQIQVQVSFDANGVLQYNFWQEIP